MEYCKLQIGCLLIVLYLTFIYYKEQRRFHLQQRMTLYDFLLASGIFCLLLDGITAFTVNHQDSVNPILNLILHGLFLFSIDTVIFTVFLYLLDTTRGLPSDRRKRFFLFLPFLLNLAVVFLALPSLEYRRDRTIYYSMGISVYTCFAMAGIYVLLTIAILFRHWNSISSHKRVSIMTCLMVVVSVTGYQMMVPDSLISSIGPTMLLIGVYMNQEDPAIQELTRYHDEMVMGFATLIESRDNSTGGHVKRSTQYVRLLAEELRRRGYYSKILTRDYMKNLLKAAPMHDVGKIAVPDMILQKPGRLTPEEFEIMNLHTIQGGKIIEETFSRMGNEEYLTMASQIALYHHEKWNGKGYPKGLKQEEIPLCARIMAVADVFDAVSADRCYRKAMPPEECFAIIQKGRGEDFDPIMVDVFLELKEDILQIMGVRI